MSDSHEAALARALVSLDGLSVGDAFGERFFMAPSKLPTLLDERWTPPAPWTWTDDTAMAISIVDVLAKKKGIDEEVLALAFGARYALEPDRGYGGGAHQILGLIARGVPFREAAVTPFSDGSFGNGGAMRSAPIGAYFFGQPELAAEHAKRSAAPTHAHPEGAAGAIAIAVAASLAHSMRGVPLINAVALLTPRGRTRDGLEEAAAMSPTLTSKEAATRLGSGANVAAFDTVPFSLFAAAHHMNDFEEALRYTVAGLGDRDTTCAIVGGIVACASPIPPHMLAAREPLPLHR